VLFSSPLLAFADTNEWKFSFIPYAWFTAQKGKIATVPPAQPADLDISFSDILENLDIALTGFFEAKKGRFGIAGEVNYASVSADIDTPGPFFSGADYEQDMLALSLMGVYQLTQNSQYQVDALLGVRHWDLDNTLKLDAGLLSARKVSERERWYDITLGLKGKTKLNEQWFLSGMINFAISGDSDKYWDAVAGINYQYKKDLSFVVGYRHQEVDYDNGDFLFDIETTGPIIGLTTSF
jgi:predicted porin